MANKRSRQRGRRLNEASEPPIIRTQNLPDPVFVEPSEEMKRLMKNKPPIPTSELLGEWPPPLPPKLEVVESDLVAPDSITFMNDITKASVDAFHKAQVDALNDNAVVSDHNDAVGLWQQQPGTWEREAVTTPVRKKGVDGKGNPIPSPQKPSPQKPSRIPAQPPGSIQSSIKAGSGLHPGALSGSGIRIAKEGDLIVQGEEGGDINVGKTLETLTKLVAKQDDVIRKLEQKVTRLERRTTRKKPVVKVRGQEPDDDIEPKPGEAVITFNGRRYSTKEYSFQFNEETGELLDVVKVKVPGRPATTIPHMHTRQLPPNQNTCNACGKVADYGELHVCNDREDMGICSECTGPVWPHARWQDGKGKEGHQSCLDPAYPTMQEGDPIPQDMCQKFEGAGDTFYQYRCKNCNYTKSDHFVHNRK